MKRFACLLALPGWVLLTGFATSVLAQDYPSRVPLQQTILYDFEHLPLGPVGQGGASQGQPQELSWAAVGQVDVIDGTIDGQSLLVTHPAAGSPTAWFQLPGNVGLTSGQVRFNFQIRPSHRDEYRVLFRRPGSAADSYLSISMHPSGNATAQSGLLASAALGTYEAGELLDFTVDFDLDQHTWSLWLRGVKLAEDRPINPNVEEGLGRIGFGLFNSAVEGHTLEFDNLEILRNAAGVTLLEANFNDKPLSEPIGTGGAAVGEPVAVSELLTTFVGNEGDSGPALFLEKEDGSAGGPGNTEWRFLNGASVQTGWLEARFDLMLGDLSNNQFILAGSDEELIRFETTVGGDLRVRFPGESTGELVGSYALGDRFPVRLVCQMDDRVCSMAVDGDWVIDRRAFAESTSPDIVIDRFHAGIAAVSRDFAFFAIDNLRISASAPAALPVTAEFVQQPTDTVCQTEFIPAPTVMVRDGLGQPVPGEWTLAVSEYTNVLGWNPLEMDADPVTADGLAELTGLRLRRTAEGARLQAVVAGYSPTVRAVSEPFNGIPGEPTDAYYEGSDDDGPFFAGRPQVLWVGVWDACNNNLPIGTVGTVVIHSGPAGAQLSNNQGVVDEWGEIELLEFTFDQPGEYVLDLELEGVRLGILSNPIFVQSDRIHHDRFEAGAD